VKWFLSSWADDGELKFSLTEKRTRSGERLSDTTLKRTNAFELSPKGFQEKVFSLWKHRPTDPVMAHFYPFIIRGLVGDTKWPKLVTYQWLLGFLQSIQTSRAESDCDESKGSNTHCTEGFNNVWGQRRLCLTELPERKASWKKYSSKINQGK